MKIRIGTRKSKLALIQTNIIKDLIEKNYSGTWCELALGGNMQLAKNNNLYFDVTRSFGGDFQKQWQVNAGVRFEF